MRRDRWWVQPFTTATVLSAFGIYTIVFALLNNDYLYTKGGARYLSPIYSPDLHDMFGLHIGFTYAFFVLWAPLGLRSTCYYYRKAYYRSFFLAPPSCAVAGLSRKKYSGETRFPLILNNLHRVFFYIAVIVIGFLSYDTVRAFIFEKPGGGHAFGIGVGGVIMLLNVLFISAFTFGCNSWRHLIGGKLDCFSCSSGAKTRHWLWGKFTILNHRHANWAWISLVSVWVTDLYIRLAVAGAFTDPHHIF